MASVEQHYGGSAWARRRESH